MDKEDSQPLLVSDSEENPHMAQTLNKISKNQIIPKSCFMKYFCCCISSNDLTNREMNRYLKLKKNCIEQYDKENPSHEELLTKFYNYGKEVYDKEGIKEQGDKLWRVFGFQTENPRQDFRGGGLFSLKFMLYYVQNKETESSQMFNTHLFSFALVCIRLTFLSRIMLRLVNDDEIETQAKTNKITLCNNKQLKHFCIGITKDEFFYYDLLAQMVFFVFTMYRSQYEEAKKEMNILLIDPLIKNAITSLYNALQDGNSENSIKECLKRELRITKK